MRMNVCQCFKCGVKLPVYLGLTVNEVFFNGVHTSYFILFCVLQD
jgi:hypothetical protein